ncbi:unnamed protein product [Ixodes persulcatus]
MLSSSTSTCGETFFKPSQTTSLCLDCLVLTSHFQSTLRLDSIGGMSTFLLTCTSFSTNQEKVWVTQMHSVDWQCKQMVSQKLLPANIFMFEEAYPSYLSPAAVAQATKNYPFWGNAVHAVLRGQGIALGPEGIPIRARSAELSLHDRCLLWGVRVAVPQVFQDQALKLLHRGYLSNENSKWSREAMSGGRVLTMILSKT